MGKTLGKILIIVAVILMGSFVAGKPSLSVEKFTVGQEAANDGRFIAYEDGTVWDTKTNLLWAARDNGSNINWEDARLYCENYSGGDSKDWRMPTKDELKGLYNRLIFGNNGYHLTQLITLTGSFPWTSDVQGSQAAVVAFGYDYDVWFRESQTHKSRNRALPVRYGKIAKSVVIELQQEVAAVAPPPQPPPPPVPAPPPPVSALPPPPLREKVTITLNVKFDYKKTVVSEKYYSDIKRVADFMKEYSDTTATIEGHTDEIGTKEYNQKLSEARADSVRKYLVDRFGIDGSRLTAVGYGEDKPIDSNYTAEGRQNNRRVEAVIETMITK
ncbi:MAG: OmpA family protein [Smithella sp.]|jgi:OOP family OmpA-OmpF porin